LERIEEGSRARRFACLVATRFPVAALLRAEPELRGCPVVVCESRRAAAEGRPVASPRDVVVEVSPEAGRLGVRAGMTVAQALVRHADLVIRPADHEAMRAGQAALLEVATTVSPQVEGPSEGVVLLDVAGVERLFGGAAGAAAALTSRAERIGFEVGVGIADGPSTARIAALAGARSGRAILVPVGGDADWLAPLPLGALAAVAEERGGRERPRWKDVFPALQRVGVHRIGDLARLPIAEVGTRFGHVGRRAWHVAAGRDPTVLLADPAPLDLTEGVELEYGMESLEGLVFVMRGLLDRVVARLQVRSLACNGLEVHLVLENGGRVELRVGVLAPTRDVKTLTMLARAALEGSPPRAPIHAVRIVAAPDRARPAQLDLYRPPSPSPERLATTLARLGALCGPGRVGRPVPPSGHRPDEMALAPFEPPGAARGTAGPPATPWGNAALALRAIRPAIPAEVYREGGGIAYVRATGLAGRTVVASGPWRIETEWWTDSPCRRDYYDVQLSDGGIYRLYQDLTAADAWFVDGCYD
jgi:protein ImuB